MGLYEEATAAYENKQSTRIAEARVNLDSILGSYDGTNLELVKSIVTPTSALVVFKDGYVYVAASYNTEKKKWEAVLVEPGATVDEWVNLATVKSLEEMGEAIYKFVEAPPAPEPTPDPTDPTPAPEPTPEPTPTTPEPWVAGISVLVSERYTYNGFTYEVLVNHMTTLADAPDKNKTFWIKVV